MLRPVPGPFPGVSIQDHTQEGAIEIYLYCYYSERPKYRPKHAQGNTV